MIWTKISHLRINDAYDDILINDIDIRHHYIKKIGKLTFAGFIILVC